MRNETKEKKQKKRKVFWICALIISAICLFITGGYYIHLRNREENEKKIAIKEKHLMRDSIIKADSIKRWQLRRDSIRHTIVARETLYSSHTPVNISASTEPSIPARTFSFLNKPFTVGFGAYGYALLNNLGSDTGFSYRNYLFAKSFMHLLNDINDYNNQYKSSLMVTYWPLRLTNNSIVIKFINAPQKALEYYDYGKATSILSAIEKLDRMGPILVAWKQPFETIKSSPSKISRYILLDLSNFDASDMERAMLIWRHFMTGTDSNFEMGVIRFREEMRNLIQKYGGCISDEVSKSKS